MVIIKMLVRLVGSNFRSLKDNFELSLVAADLKRKEDSARGTICSKIEGLDEPLRLLKTVAIYGPNGSGKSTVLTAARALRWLSTESSQSARPGGTIPPFEPFLLDGLSEKNVLTLGCDVIYRKKHLLRYSISFDSKTIQSEDLSIGQTNGWLPLIERKSNGEVLGRLIENSEANKLYVKSMQPNVSVLSKLAQHGPIEGKESVLPYYQSIKDATTFVDYSDAAQARIKIGGTTDDRFADDEEYRNWIMKHLIRPADVGICDVRTKRENLQIPTFLKEQFEKDDKLFKLPNTRVVVNFLHEGKSVKPIDFVNESAGTKKLFNIASDWWALGNTEITLFADELSASLHPTLLERVVRAVNESKVRSQLIFTTHDAGLLESHDGNPPALRRDQVYFTKKDVDGASNLYSLAEFKDGARSVHNLRKRYISGLYGAIPSVARLSL